MVRHDYMSVHLEKSIKLQYKLTFQLIKVSGMYGKHGKYLHHIHNAFALEFKYKTTKNIV